MNIQTFLCNENFYKKLALTVAIIRSTPTHLTPREYTIELQNILRRNKINQSIQFEQILSDLQSFRKSKSIIIPTKSFDLIESHSNFLQTIFTQSIDLNLEIQSIVIETIQRIFELIKENFSLIKQQKYETLFKQSINIILNYDIIPNIHKHSIEHIRNFLDLIFTYIKQSTNANSAQMLIEQIGYRPSNFLLVFERLIAELFDYFDKTNTNPSYASTLIDILQKLVTTHDQTILEQILNNDSVRQQYHTLLYTCLSMNHNNLPLIIHLWNIYGRIL